MAAIIISSAISSESAEWLVPSVMVPDPLFNSTKVLLMLSSSSCVALIKEPPPSEEDAEGTPDTEPLRKNGESTSEDIR